MKHKYIYIFNNYHIICIYYDIILLEISEKMFCTFFYSN